MCSPVEGIQYHTLRLKEHQFQEHDRKLRSKVFTPVARIVPQVLKQVKYYDDKASTPNYTQWGFQYPIPGANKLKHIDSEISGLLVLKYVENRLTNQVDVQITKTKLSDYRAHIARTIF